MIRLVSFDIGHLNFAQYVEDFDPDAIFALEERYRSLPRYLQRRVKGPMNDEIAELLEESVLAGKRVQTGVYAFAVKNQGLDIRARLSLLEHLSRFEKLWDTCDIFVLEQQFFNTGGARSARGKRKARGGANIDAIKIGEATFMWLLKRYASFKTIVYFGSNFKTQIFGAPWKMNKPARKKWAEAKARAIYTLRKDRDMTQLYDLAEGVKRKRITTEARVQSFKDAYTPECTSKDARKLANKIIREKQKLDDISDAFMQAQAFKFRMMIGCF